MQEQSAPTDPDHATSAGVDDAGAPAHAEALRALMAALARARTSAEVVAAAVGEGRGAVGSSGGAVALLDESGTTFTLVGGPGIPADVAEAWATYPNAGDLPAARAVRTGRPCYSRTRAEYAAGDAALLDTARRLGIEAEATLPLVAGGRTLGVLSFIFAAPRAFDGAEDAYLRSVAGLCAQALERARLFEAERAARAEAEAERRRLALVLDQLPMGVIVVDPRGAILHHNPMLERLLGHPVHEADDVVDYVQYGGLHPDGRAYVPGDYPIARALLHEEVVDQEVTRYRRGDGTETTLAISAAPVRDGDDALCYAVATVQDVSHQRELEERLRQAQKMEAVGQLAGGVAHDFNNLLTVITGSLEFAHEGLAADHPVRADLAPIAAAAERARSLVRQLLAFSRRQPNLPRIVRVGDVIRGAERLLRRVIGEEISLETAVEDEGLVVRADPGQLEQVLMNLAVNARDAMLTPRHGHPGGGGTLTVAVSPTTVEAPQVVAGETIAPGTWLRVTVHDTGHGMDVETVAHAFEPFFTTKKLGEGTGLGLATVHGIARQAGGTVTIESEPGEGTTVSLLFPAMVGTPEAHGAAEPARPRRAAGEIVLVVEDEASLRAIVRRALMRQGYTVLEARHGRDALAVWRRHHASIRAVVTDLRMPEMGGLELVAHLRSEVPALPVVFMSGYADMVGGFPLGPTERFLEKPFSVDALLSAVGALIPERR